MGEIQVVVKEGQRYRFISGVLFSFEYFTADRKTIFVMNINGRSYPLIH